MKTLTMKNKDLLSLFQALENIKVEGYKPRRGKGKFSKGIQEKYKEYNESLNEIREDYFQKDDDDGFKTNGNNLIWLDEYKEHLEAKKQFAKASEELLDEEVKLDLVEHETKIKAFFEALKNDEFTAEKELDDKAFDTLLDVLEDAFEDGKDDK